MAPPFNAFHLASLDFAIPAAEELHELTSEQLALLQFHPDSTDALRTAAAALFWERRRQDAQTTTVAASGPATPTDGSALNVPGSSGLSQGEGEGAPSTAEGLPAAVTDTNAVVDLVSPISDSDETSSAVRTASTSAAQLETPVTASSNEAVTLSAGKEKAGSFSASDNETTGAEAWRSNPVISGESTGNASVKPPAQPHGSVPSETEPGEVLETAEDPSERVEHVTGGTSGQDAERKNGQAVLDATSPAKKSKTRKRTHKGEKPLQQNDVGASMSREGDAGEGDEGRERRVAATQPASGTGLRKGADAEPARKRRKTQARERTRSSATASDADCSCSECEPLSSSTFSSAPSFCSCSGCESSGASSSSPRPRRKPAHLRSKERDRRKSVKSSSSRSKKPSRSGERPRDIQLPFKPASKPQNQPSSRSGLPPRPQISYDGFSTQQYLPVHGYPATQAALEDEEEEMTRQQLSHLHRSAPTNPAEKQIVTDRTRAMTRSPPRAVKNSYSFPGEPPAALTSRTESAGRWAGQPQGEVRPQQRGRHGSQLSASQGQVGSYTGTAFKSGRPGSATHVGDFSASTAARAGNSAWGDSPPSTAAPTSAKPWGNASVGQAVPTQSASTQAVVSSAWDSSPEPEPRGGRRAPASNAPSAPAAARPGPQYQHHTNGQASARGAPATGTSWEENQLRLSQQYQQRQTIDYAPAHAKSAWGDSPPTDSGRQCQNSGFAAPSRDTGWGARRSPTTGVATGAPYKRNALAGRIGAREDDGPQWGRPRDRDSRYRERSPHSGYDMTPGHGRQVHDDRRQRREGSRDYEHGGSKERDKERPSYKRGDREREEERGVDRARYRSRSPQRDRAEPRADQNSAWDS